MSKKIDWKVGDVVYVLTLAQRVIKSTIKAIHEEDKKLPYELDLDTPCRFYAAKDLYKTARTARLHAMDERWCTQQETTVARNACYNAKTGTYKTEDGEDVPKYFQLSDKELNRLKELMKPLLVFCEEKQVPLILLAVVANNSSSTQHMFSGYVPGPRASTLMASIVNFVRDEGHTKD